jgi:hypothetical protein
MKSGPFADGLNAATKGASAQREGRLIVKDQLSNTKRILYVWNTVVTAEDGKRDAENS